MTFMIIKKTYFKIEVIFGRTEEKIYTVFGYNGIVKIFHFERQTLFVYIEYHNICLTLNSNSRKRCCMREYIFRLTEAKLMEPHYLMVPFRFLTTFPSCNKE